MYQYSILKNPDEKQILHILNLYKAANWWEEDSNGTDIIDKIISGSYIFMIAVCQDKIIGMGRVISDGVSDAYIQDVTVDKEYRNRKIGSKIVRGRPLLLKYISSSVKNINSFHINL